MLTAGVPVCLQHLTAIIYYIAGLCRTRLWKCILITALLIDEVEKTFEGETGDFVDFRDT